MEKECFNCCHYITFNGGEVEICLKHRIRIYAEDGISCYGWMPCDDLYDNVTLVRKKQKDDQSVSRQE